MAGGHVSGDRALRGCGEIEIIVIRDLRRDRHGKNLIFLFYNKLERLIVTLQKQTYVL